MMQIDIMHNLVHLYAAKASLSRPEKERKIQLCNKVLDVLTKVDSGYTIWRGTLLQVGRSGTLERLDKMRPVGYQGRDSIGKKSWP